ncbi:heat shock factor binding protein 1-domain-containing protein [Obelidium mucronatum]|nr:heat shock factor binding protein 1-domain-containing protein [Obelidium mucronatum]
MNNANTPSSNNSEELSVFVESLLAQMQSKFNNLSDEILGKMDAMGSRIKELESSLEELVKSSEADEHDVSKRASDSVRQLNQQQ